jgi:hypothetical protein
LAEEAQTAFILEKLKILEDAVQDIDIETIAAARAGHTWTRTARTTKKSNRWVPVGHNWRHHGADNDKCPACGAPDGTFAHLFHCPNTKLRAVCKEAVEHIRRAGTLLKISASIMWLLLRILKHECKISLKIWEAQSQIGFHNLITGCISRWWQRGLRIYHSDDPGGKQLRYSH